MSPSESTIAQWVRAIDGRPEWALWGKAQPTDDQQAPAHPLICHMLDVGLVARRMLEQALPRVLVDRVVDTFGLNEGEALAWTAFVVALHDLGKASPAFQAKAPSLSPSLSQVGLRMDPPRESRNHGLLGMLWIHDALSQRGIERKASLRLARSVSAHHGEFPSDSDALEMPGRREAGHAPEWSRARATIVDQLALVTGVDKASKPGPAFIANHAFTVLLAGLTSVADWIGSMAIVFRYEYPLGSLAEYERIAADRAAKALDVIAFGDPHPGSRRGFTELFSFDEPWPLHRAVEQVSRGLAGPALIVVEAPMGEGKTEAAFLLAEHSAHDHGHSGLFVGLPTQATSNQMLGRLERFLSNAHASIRSNLQLIHGGASLVERYQKLIRAVYDDAGDDGGVRAETWFVDKKRALLSSHAVGTIDQALLGVLRTRHGFVRLFGLAGKTVVLDEVHAYDVYTSTLLERLVEWLGALGATVVLLSATLPSSRRKRLLGAYLGTECEERDVIAYPRLSIAHGGRMYQRSFETLRPSVDVLLERKSGGEGDLAEDMVDRIRHGGCAGWICNTVARAQSAYRALTGLRDRGVLPEDTRLLLIHGRLLHEDRAAREVLLERFLGPRSTRPSRMIVVGTQVLEQSLDIDFDVLTTDVAPIDLVLQRAGRLHRHRRKRPPLHEAPRLILVGIGLADDLSDASMREVAGIYVEYVMRRTSIALSGRTSLRLPDDIEPLVEGVYGPEDPAHANELRESRGEYDEWRRSQEIAARTRVLGSPTSTDDIFAQFAVSLRDDDDPRLADELRAVTRLGDPTIDVICLESRNGEVFIGGEKNQSIDLDIEPNPKQIRALLGRATRLSSPRLVGALVRQGPPRAWQGSPFLRHRRLLVFKDGVASVEGYHLELNSELGIVIRNPGDTG